MLVRRITKSIAVLGLATAASFGATPVARVIGAQPVEVDGIATPQGNYTPVSAGSVVTTKAGVAVLQFRDGSNVALEPNSTVRVEGQAAELKVRIVRGSATYSITSKSHLKIVDSKGETINRLLDHTLPQSAATVNRSLAMEPGILYRGNNRQAGGVAPTAAIAVAQFTGSGTFHAAAGGQTASIMTPTGLTINLTASVSPSGQTIYTISSISQTVNLPGGGQAAVTIPANSPLIGATLTFTPAQGPNGTAVGNIQITGRGQGTPMPPTSVQQALQQGVTTSVNAGINNGTLPNGTTPPSPSPVATGKFSSTAP